MYNQSNDKEDIEMDFDEEQYIVPSKWLAVLLVIQIGIIAFLIHIISKTYISNNNEIASILYILSFLAVGGLLFYSWKQAKLKRNRSVLKITLILFGAYILLSILYAVAYIFLNELLRFIFKDSGGWL